MNVREVIRGLLYEMNGYEGPVDDGVRLYQDTGLHGIDAGEFLEGITKRFGTRFDDLRYSDYFADEGELFAKMRPRNTFTIGHLIKVIDQGCWMPPDGQYARVMQDEDWPVSSPEEARRFWMRLGLIFVLGVLGTLISFTFFR